MSKERPVKIKGESFEGLKDNPKNLKEKTPITESDQNKKEAANFIMKSLKAIKNNWNKSAAILGVGVATSIPGMAQENPNKLADNEFFNQENKRVEYVAKTNSGNYTIPKKRNKGENIKTTSELEKEYKKELKITSLEDFLSEDGTDSDSFDFIINNVEKSFKMGSGKTFRAGIETRDGVKGFKGERGEVEYEAHLINIATPKPKKENINQKAEDFYMEIKTSEGIRQFKGAAGKKEYEEFMNRVKKQTANQPENLNKENKKGVKDKDFYMEIRTSQGLRIFKGAAGKKAYEAFLRQNQQANKYQQRPMTQNPQKRMPPNYNNKPKPPYALY